MLFNLAVVLKFLHVRKDQQKKNKKNSCWKSVDCWIVDNNKVYYWFGVVYSSTGKILNLKGIPWIIMKLKDWLVHTQ